MISPPRIAGSASGKVTRRMVRHVPAPRMLAASSISDDTQLEGRRGEDEDIRERIERDDDGEAGEAVELNGPASALVTNI